MESRISRQDRELGLGVMKASDSYRSGYVYTIVSYAMSVRDFVVEVGLAAGNITITLPPVAEARGKIYTIALLDADTHDYTVTDKGDDPRWSDIVLGDDHDYLVLFSNGKRWFELAEMSDAGER
jgi:hypothetical protein